MQIELNGMYYILNLPRPGPDGSLTAEIVDEAFTFPPRRAAITGIGELVGLIRAHTGLTPDRDLLRELSELLETRLDAVLETSHPAHLSLPLQRTA